MKASEIRDLSTDAIRTRINDSQEELMRLRFQQATGELTDHSQVRQVRRRVARLLTILNEREQAARIEGE